ncbi:MAG: hypothetical protein K2Y27_15965 [Xanthobacteraceae bacterium]|nr:hypothetical protein [Xanthobacteraceae bacterium]
MPLFYFVLRAGRQTIADRDGQELADEAAARRYATDVARQLMRNREGDTRGWRVQVCDDYLRPLFEVFFAEVDESLKGYPPGYQRAIGQVARTAAGLNDAVTAMRVTLTDVQTTLQRAGRLLASLSPRGGADARDAECARGREHGTGPRRSNTQGRG